MTKQWRKIWFSYFVSCKTKDLVAAIEDEPLSKEQKFALDALLALSED